MTVESLEEVVSEGGDVVQQSETEQQVDAEGECVEEVKDEPPGVVGELDGKVEECTPEVPLPYGPDDSVDDGKEDEECGFCLFMKAGPCGKRFAAWEACVDDAETSGLNIVEKCAPKTLFLKECMEANPEYYGPILQAEKAMDEQTATEGSETGGEVNRSNSNEILQT